MSAVTIQQLNNAGSDCEHIADIATSAALTATDRLGRTKLTLQGALASLGYQVPVAYTAGINLTQGTQTVEYDGIVYAPLVAELPFTTSGTFESAKFHTVQVTDAEFISLPQGGNVKTHALVRFSDVINMRTNAGVLDGQVVYLAGHTQEGVGGGVFFWDASSTDTDDNGTIFAVGGVATGRWKRIIDGAICLDWFGALPETDVSNALEDAIIAANALAYQGGNAYFDASNVTIEVAPGKRYYTSREITFLPRVDIVCNGVTLFEAMTDKTHMFLNGNQVVNFRLEGLRFSRYNKVLRAKTDNADMSTYYFKRVEADNCTEMFDTVGFDESRSTLVVLDNCKSGYGVERVISAYCDKVRVLGGWYTHNQNTSMFYVDGHLDVEGGVYVPVANVTANNARCWYELNMSDISRGAHFKGCRFGAESGSQPIVVVSGANFDGSADAYDARNVSFESCIMASNAIYNPNSVPGGGQRANVILRAFPRGGISFRGCTHYPDLGPGGNGEATNGVVALYGILASAAPDGFGIQFDDASYASATRGVNSPAVDSLLPFVNNGALRGMVSGCCADGHLFVNQQAASGSHRATFTIHAGRDAADYASPLAFMLVTGAMGDVSANNFNYTSTACYLLRVLSVFEGGQVVYKVEASSLYADISGSASAVLPAISSVHFGSNNTGSATIAATGPSQALIVSVIFGGNSARGFARLIPLTSALKSSVYSR